MPNLTNNKLVDSKTIAALFDMTPSPSAAAHQGGRHHRGQGRQRQPLRPAADDPEGTSDT
ncbi:MAG: hypothetical protein ACLU38_04340 [Dysosmobacter sp.]